MKTSLLQQQVTLLKDLVKEYELYVDISTSRTVKDIKKSLSALESIDQEGKEAITQPPLYPCPYSIAVYCIMEEPCKGCETWAKYLAGEEESRMQSPAPTVDETDTIMSVLVFLGKEGYINPNTTISYCTMMQRYLSSKATKQTEK